MSAADIFAVADLSNPVDIAMLADALADAGRDAEADVVRSGRPITRQTDGVFRFVRPIRPTIQLGSISSGTMRTQDLLSAFADALDDIKDDISTGCQTTDTADDTAIRTAETARIDTFLAALESRMDNDDDDARDDYLDSGYAEEDLDTLTFMLSNYTPPYCYFGSHPGNGSDYGFWIDHESLESDVRDGTLASGDEAPEDADEGSLFLHINERGNTELYIRQDGEWVSVWSVV